MKRSISRTTDAVQSFILALVVASIPTGCARSRAASKPVQQAAAFSPEGRWRSSMLGTIMTAHLRPDGTLEMIDSHGGRHPFQRIAPNQWKARISREATGSFHPEGDQLVFRIEPTPEASKPIAQKNGLMIVHSIKPREDRMTRVTGTSNGH
jgi:hypothetical protein